MIGPAPKPGNRGRRETLNELSLMHHAIILEYLEGRDDIIRIIMAKYKHKDGGAIADENEMRGTSVYRTVA